jgi:hypothetical protein
MDRYKWAVQNNTIHRGCGSMCTQIGKGSQAIRATDVILDVILGPAKHLKPACPTLGFSQAPPARNAFKWCDCQETGYNLGHDSNVSLRSLWCCNMS